jgi:lysophospholipase L1-like esterase
MNPMTSAISTSRRGGAEPFDRKSLLTLAAAIAVVVGQLLFLLTPGTASAAMNSRLSGAVRGPDGPLAGIAVSVVRPDGVTAASTSTDAVGNYVTPWLEPGPYRISFINWNTVGEVWFGDEQDEHSAPFVLLAANTTMTLGSVELYPADQIGVPPYTSRPGGPRVAVMGDSLVQGGVYAIHQALDPVAATSARGINGQRIDQMLPVAQKFASSKPDQLIVALGANDSFQGWPTTVSVDTMRQLVGTLPTRTCTTILTMSTTTAWPTFNANSRRLDDALARLRDSIPNVQIVDWGREIDDYTNAGSPFGTWVTDSLHMNDLGQSAFAGAMRSAVKSCPQRTSAYTSIEPARVVDTRTANVPDGWSAQRPMLGGETMHVQVAGQDGIPATATAVSLNVTSTQAADARAFLTVWPSGGPRPLVSSVNPQFDANVGNLVTVGVGNGGSVDVYTNIGSTHLVIDATGYYAPALGTHLAPVEPTRLFDSRSDPTPGRPAGQAIVGGQTVNVPVTGVAGVPTQVGAVMINVTATGGTDPRAFVTAYPSGHARPATSNLNVRAGTNVANLVTVGVGTNGAISLYTNIGSTHLVVDVMGYFAIGDNTDLVPATPVRLLDTREPGDITSGHTVPAGGTVSLHLQPSAQVAPTAKAVLVNITTTDAVSSFGYTTAFPTGQGVPDTSNVNHQPGANVPNLALVPIGTDGSITLMNGFGAADLVIDLFGIVT